MIHILIPVHNGLDETVKCLASLAKQTYTDYEVCVIDDGSTDGTQDYLRENYPSVKIISGSGNLWWTGAMRTGVDWVLRNGFDDRDFLMSLNNDVILPADTLSRLYRFAVENDRAIVNALAVDSGDRDTIVSSGSRMISWILNISRHPFEGVSYREIRKEPVEVDMLSGRSVLYPIEVFRSVGNFDDVMFPHYAGDNEFTVRAKRHGWRLYLLPSAIVYVNQRTTGLNPNAKKLTFREAIRSLTTIKSTNNLMIRTKLALRCCPWYAVPTFLLVMYCKIIVLTILGRKPRLRRDSGA